MFIVLCFTASHELGVRGQGTQHKLIGGFGSDPAPPPWTFAVRILSVSVQLLVKEI